MTNKKAKDILFVGSREGLFQATYKNGKWSDAAQIPNLDERAWAVTEDTKGNLWVSTYFHGLFSVLTVSVTPISASGNRVFRND